MFRKKLLLSTAIVMAVLGGREFVEAQSKVKKPKEVKENLEEKFANVSPKLTSNNANPLLDFMFTALVAFASLSMAKAPTKSGQTVVT
jgi:arabinoxylan arabinofuranohydrolase